MKFMMLVKADADYEAGKPPTPELEAAIGALIEKTARAGQLVTMGGLLPTSNGARSLGVSVANNRVYVATTAKDAPCRGCISVFAAE